MADEKEITREQIEAWLSSARYASYLAAADGDDITAFELYLWNTGLAQAVLRDVSFFEIALRNAYNRCLDNGFDGEAHWLFDDASPIRRPILRTNKRKMIVDSNRINRNTIDRLCNGLESNGSVATPDDVISNLTLGFWVHMTDAKHERDLWIPLLHKVWKAGTSRKKLFGILADINNTRNRAAHHEHLFSIGNADCKTKESCRNAVELFSELQPDIAVRIFGESLKSSVDDYLAKNPAPCDVNV